MRDATHSNTKNSAFRWLLPLALAVTALLVFIEIKYPYYFLEDDNRDYWLGLFVYYYRAVFAHGQLALFNFHQFLGSPSIGASQALYPFVYTSVFLSRLLSGTDMWTMDIFIATHAVIASAGFFLFARALGASEKASFLAAFAWAFNGFLMFIGPSWWFAAPAWAYLPWTHLFVLRILERPGPSGAIALAFIRIFFFYTGYGQYFVYATLMEILFFSFIAVKTRRASLGQAARSYALSFVCTFILALPLLLPTLHQMALSQFRSQPMLYKDYAAGGMNIWLWLWGLIYPFVYAETAQHFLGIANPFFLDAATPHAAHIGYAALAALTVLVFRRRESVSASAKPLAACFAVSLLWACGAFNRLIYLLPVLNRFRWHFKLGIIADFYLLALAALGFGLILSRAEKWKKLPAFGLLLGLTVLNFAALYTAGYPRGFIAHNEPNPISEPLRDKLAQGRIFSLGYVSGRDFDPQSLGFNYASLWGLYHFAGYDSFVLKANMEAALGFNYVSAYCGPLLPNAVDYLRKWGVRWYVVKKSEVPRYTAELLRYGITPRYEDAGRAVFEDNKALPFVYWQGTAQCAPPRFTVRANSIDIYPACAGKNQLIANALYNDFFRYSVDGGEWAKPEKTKNNRMLLSAPAGTRHIELKYINPYFNAGAWAAAGFILLLCAAPAWRKLKPEAAAARP